MGRRGEIKTNVGVVKTRTFSKPPIGNKIRQVEFTYRDGTSDVNVIDEVVIKQVYQRSRPKFGVEPGEHWLDLGGNIGAFALHCWLNGAICDSYEPEPGCFAILSKNIKALNAAKPPIILPEHQAAYTAHNFAVTAHNADNIPFYRGRADDDFYRFTERENSYPIGELPNLYAGDLLDSAWDGIKMDIEGSELYLIDNGLIPECNKLIMEYHITKDRGLQNFHNRMDILKSRFNHVHYPPSLDRGYGEDEKGRPKDYPGFFDRFVICWN